MHDMQYHDDSPANHSKQHRSWPPRSIQSLVRPVDVGSHSGGWGRRPPARDALQPAIETLDIFGAQKMREAPGENLAIEEANVCYAPPTLPA